MVFYLNNIPVMQVFGLFTYRKPLGSISKQFPLYKGARFKSVYTIPKAVICFYFNKYHPIYIQLLYLYHNIESLKTLKGSGYLSVVPYGVKLI